MTHSSWKKHPSILLLDAQRDLGLKWTNEFSIYYWPMSIKNQSDLNEEKKMSQW